MELTFPNQKFHRKTTRTFFWGDAKKLSFNFFSDGLFSPPFHTKQTDKPRWFHDSARDVFFWFAHSGHDPLLVALAYSICRDGNKKKIQKMKLPSHFHGRTGKKEKKKTRRIQIWRSETDFCRFFRQKIFQQKSLSSQRRIDLGTLRFAWKASAVEKWADGWHVDAKRLGNWMEVFLKN